MIEGHGVDDALEPVAFPVFESDGLDIAVFGVAGIEGETVEGSLLADVLVDHERSGLLGRPETVVALLVNLRSKTNNYE